MEPLFRITLSLSGAPAFADLITVTFSLPKNFFFPSLKQRKLPLAPHALATLLGRDFLAFLPKL